jgi:hypothetical protein
LLESLGIAAREHGFKTRNRSNIWRCRLSACFVQRRLKLAWHFECPPPLDKFSDANPIAGAGSASATSIASFSGAQRPAEADRGRGDQHQYGAQASAQASTALRGQRVLSPAAGEHQHRTRQYTGRIHQPGSRGAADRLTDALPAPGRTAAASPHRPRPLEVTTMTPPAHFTTDQRPIRITRRPVEPLPPATFGPRLRPDPPYANAGR